MHQVATTCRKDGSTVSRLIEPDGNRRSITVAWTAFNKQVALIDADGIFRVTTDPTDENAALFIECIERVLKRRIAGIEASNG